MRTMAAGACSLFSQRRVCASQERRKQEQGRLPHDDLRTVPVRGLATGAPDAEAPDPTAQLVHAGLADHDRQPAHRPQPRWAAAGLRSLGTAWGGILCNHMGRIVQLGCGAGAALGGWTGAGEASDVLGTLLRMSRMARRQFAGCAAEGIATVLGSLLPAASDKSARDLPLFLPILLRDVALAGWFFSMWGIVVWSRARCCIYTADLLHLHIRVLPC
jgi:hypothetical protein